MSRPALAATRAIDIINYLAAHPTESFTLSDIVKRVGINVASAHAILFVLTDAGYLVRHSRLRTYSLGPSLVAVGSAALEHHRAIDIARDEFRSLCEQLSLEGAVCAPAGDEIVFVARAGEHQPRGMPLHVGHRVPLVPPLGPVYVAWSESATEGWLARARGSATAEELDGYRGLLRSVRARGYSVALEAKARRGLGEALEKLADAPRAPLVHSAIRGLIAELGHDEYQVREIDSARRYDVSTIAAPVFDTDGHVALVLTLGGFAPGLSASAVLSYSERLRGAALLVTKRTHGSIPTRN